MFPFLRPLLTITRQVILRLATTVSLGKSFRIHPEQMAFIPFRIINSREWTSEIVNYCCKIISPRINGKFQLRALYPCKDDMHLLRNNIFFLTKSTLTIIVAFKSDIDIPE